MKYVYLNKKEDQNNIELYKDLLKSGGVLSWVWDNTASHHRDSDYTKKRTNMAFVIDVDTTPGIIANRPNKYKCMRTDKSLRTVNHTAYWDNAEPITAEELKALRAESHNPLFSFMAFIMWMLILACLATKILALLFVAMIPFTILLVLHKKLGDVVQYYQKGEPD